MGKRLKSDQTDQLIVAEIVEMIDGGDERFSFSDFLDILRLRRIHHCCLNGRSGVWSEKADHGKRQSGSRCGEASERGRGKKAAPPRFCLAGKTRGTDDIIGEPGAGDLGSGLVKQLPNGVGFPGVVRWRGVAIHG